jgi:hypothetical protein
VPEAEIKAAIAGTKAALAERAMMQELGLEQQGPTPILEDNDTTRRTLMGLTGQTTAMRHQAQQIGFVEEHVRQGAVVIERCSGLEQPADGLTKVLGPTAHWFQFAPKLLGLSPELAQMQQRVLAKFGRRTSRQREEGDEAAQREYEALTQGPGAAPDDRPAYVVQIERLRESREEDEMSDVALREERERADRGRMARRNSRTASDGQGALARTSTLREELAERSGREGEPRRSCTEGRLSERMCERGHGHGCGELDQGTRGTRRWRDDTPPGKDEVRRLTEEGCDARRTGPSPHNTRRGSSPRKKMRCTENWPLTS